MVVLCGCLRGMERQDGAGEKERERWSEREREREMCTAMQVICTLCKCSYSCATVLFTTAHCVQCILYNSVNNSVI